MAKKVFTDESLELFVDKIKEYTDNKISYIPIHNELTNEQIDEIIGPFDGSIEDDSGSGGIIISPNINLDGTLTQSGMAADAKVVGDRLLTKADIGHTHNVVTTSANGLMSSVDKIKLDSIDAIIKTEVTLLSSAWVSSDSNNIYTQIVSLNGITSNSCVDLKPSPEQLESLFDKEISMTIINDNGTLIAYAFGSSPSVDYTIQVHITEVAS